MNQVRLRYTTAMEIIPRCSPSLLPIFVNEISTFASNRGMELNHKKCKEMVISFLKMMSRGLIQFMSLAFPCSQYHPLSSMPITIL